MEICGFPTSSSRSPFVLSCGQFIIHVLDRHPHNYIVSPYKVQTTTVGGGKAGSIVSSISFGTYPSRREVYTLSVKSPVPSSS